LALTVGLAGACGFVWAYSRAAVGRFREAVEQRVAAWNRVRASLTTERHRRQGGAKGL